MIKTMLRNWPNESRPRERLIKEGVASLSDAEILAIVLRTGTHGKSVVQLAQELINKFGGVRGLLACDYQQLSSIKGLGQAKYSQLAAVKELAQRCLKQELQLKPAINSANLANEYLLTTMRDYCSEVFACLLLNTKNQLICYEELFSGSINHASIYPREVVKLVLKRNATSVIFAHNHPSGSIQPSEADVKITQRLKHALGLIDVTVLDHVIVGESTYSMAENGLL